MLLTLIAQELVDKKMKGKNFSLSGKLLKFLWVCLRDMKWFIGLISLLVIFNPASVQAMMEDWFSDFDNYNQDSFIQNNINVSANTGGNKSGSGQNIKAGDYKVEVEVTNEINGQKIEPININIDANTTTKSFSKIVNTTSTKTKIDVNINQKNSDNQEIDANGNIEKQNQVLVKSTTKTIGQIFYGFFKNVFKKIFFFL